MLKTTNNDERQRFSRQQRRFTGFGKKHSEKPVSKTHSLQCRITELEEEIARLHSRVNFFQDMFFKDD